MKFKISYLHPLVALLVSHGYVLRFREKLLQMDLCIHMEQGTEFKL